MGFPIPGDAIEQSLDLNRYLVHNSAATFFMRVEGDMVTDGEVQTGDLLMVDRSLAVQHNSLVVAIIDGQMVVLRMAKQGHHWQPALAEKASAGDSLEIWGIVTHLIRHFIEPTSV